MRGSSVDPEFKVFLLVLVKYIKYDDFKPRNVTWPGSIWKDINTDSRWLQASIKQAAKEDHR